MDDWWFARTAAPERRDPAGRGGTASAAARGGLSPSGSAAGAPEPPSITLPKGGGAIRGIDEKVSVSPATGSASLSIPLPVSPSRGSLAPSLALDYSSASGQGPFGLGWRLAMPSITRKTSQGLPLYEDGRDSDVFVLSEAEDLVPLLVESGSAWAEQSAPDPSGRYSIRRYRPRVESAFARIERWQELATGDTHWRTTSRDNVTSWYGTDGSSRIADPADGTRVFSWLLDRRYDDRGNVLVCAYKQEDGANVPGALHEQRREVGASRYLKRILYGNTTPYQPREGGALPSAWRFELVLDYGEHDLADPQPAETTSWPCRPDPFSTYRSGFEIRTYRLCRRTLMFHHFGESLPRDAVLVRSTELGYSTDSPSDPTLPTLSLLTSVTQTGHRLDGAGQYQTRSLPPVELGYAGIEIDDTVRIADGDALANLPAGVDGNRWRWTDLDGEGLQGVLTEDDGAWYFRRNISAFDPGGAPLRPRFEPLEVVATKPAAELPGRTDLLDLHGDGRLCAVSFAPPTPGYYERDGDGWLPFATFGTLPSVDWASANMRHVDLDGDGLSDLLLTDDDGFTWYPWLARDGFGEAAQVMSGRDEDAGPALVFANGESSVYLADLSGDGLSDLVRIRRGEVCYWPNLGHGRFGPKVEMDGAPSFDLVDAFDPRRIRLVDIDGSGTTDLIYLGTQGATLWFNQSGNAWTAPIALERFPSVDDAASVVPVDLLGTGTACLAWSSPLPGNEGSQLRYVDLMNSTKPHLLDRIVNNLGAETTISYSTSTRFYVEDRLAGIDWLTRLPFPVHVVAQIVTVDRIAGTRVASSYRYRHGFFDPVDREFRGFARVEQTDTDALPAAAGIGSFTLTPSVDGNEFTLPPVRTVTWFHTGAYVGGADLAALLGAEFYQGDPQAIRLPGTVFDGSATPEEAREACRALRGRSLRSEVYADDGSPAAVHPYSTTESRHEVRLLQPPTEASYGSVYAFELESLGYHYERRPDDPRLSHTLTLEVDPLGNVIRSAAVGYSRRVPAFPEQGVTLVALTEHDVANVTDQDWYRLGVPVESRTYELTGISPAAGQALYDPAALAQAAASAAAIAPEIDPDGSAQKRLLARSRTIYRSDDLVNPLPEGSVESMAIVDHGYELRSTPGLLAKALGGAITAPAATTIATSPEGGLVDLDGDGSLWAPSARTFYSPDPATPDAAFAAARFYLPQGHVDPFGGVARVEWEYDQAVVGATDPVGNHTQAAINYRVIQPWLVTDANENRAGVRFDELGMVVATAAMGKQLADGSDEGDHLDLSIAEPSSSDDPTATFDYDLDSYRTWASDPAADPDRPHPLVARTRARVRHRDPASPWLETSVYGDGTGRVTLTKSQAEPGEAPVRDPSGHLVRAADGSLTFAATTSRFVGSGKVVYDAKGNPVKAYEPFFDSGPGFDVDADLAEWGVTAIARYDPLSRLIRTDNPDGTFKSVEFDAWRQLTFDENDNVLASRWYAARSGGQLGPDQLDAATKAAHHDSTPFVADLDALGRTFRTVADGPNGKLETRLVMDIQGRVLATVDAYGRAVERVDHDLAGHGIHVASVDAGERWTLLDAAGAPLQGWDSRGHHLRHAYDAAHRPLGTYVSVGGAPERLAESAVYGEGQANAVELNLRGAAFELRDGAGVVRTDRRDFKGNTVSATRQLAADARAELDWASAPALDPETFTTTSAFDALNRVTSRATPDGSVTRPVFNERSFLASISVNVRGGAAATAFVGAVTYDAKGQRLSIEYGNGAATAYSYEPETFRLSTLVTTRTAAGGPLQQLAYTYDPVGNITRLADTAQSTLFYANQLVAPVADYTYDETYRLVTATGREHIGQTSGAPVGWDDSSRQAVPLPTDPAAMRNYTETYAYDLVGNFASFAHSAGPIGSWTRAYRYDEPTSPPVNNRLTSTQVGSIAEQYTYDVHGNMTAMPHLPLMQWDYKDQLEATAAQVVNGGDPQTTWYRYDAGGNRVRKASVGSAGGPLSDRAYLGGYEVYREFGPSGAVTLERQTLHVSDGGKRIAILETTTIDTQPGAPPPATVTRYQLTNHLGSATLELDEAAAVISYEEYYPYGSTSFQSGRSAAEVGLKRYRFTGKERDAESRLYYHGARYYASWICRWTQTDPAGIAGGISLYVYCRGDPVRLVDPDGGEPKDSGQMWFYELRAFWQEITATATGYMPEPVRKDLQTMARWWGDSGKIDVSHERPLALTRAAERTNVFGERSSRNQERGATVEKAEVDAARARGDFTRTSRRDPTAKPGTRYGQPPTAEPYTTKEFKTFKASPANTPQPQPGASASAPAEPHGTPPAKSNQLEFAFGEPEVPTASAPKGAGPTGGNAFTTVGNVVTALLTIKQVYSELRAGRPAAAVKTGGTALGLAAIASKFPGLGTALGLALATLGSYDDEAKADSFRAGSYVERHLHSRVLGGVAAAGAAVGESGYKGVKSVFVTTGTMIGEGVGWLVVHTSMPSDYMKHLDWTQIYYATHPPM